jgi:hypothetical protein
MMIPKPVERHDPGNLTPKQMDRSNQSGVQNRGPSKSQGMRWEPGRASLERRESLKNSTPGTNVEWKAGSTPQGKAIITGSKPTPSIFDRHMEQKQNEGGDEDRDPIGPSPKLAKVNKYGRTPGGGGGGGEGQGTENL